MTRKTLAVGAVVILVAGCVYVLISGSDDSDNSGKTTDVAFTSQMVPHHEAAIEMAMLAQRKAEHPEIAQLAKEIVKTQSSEIQTLDSIHDRLTEGSGMSDETMGMSDTMMGMDMDVTELETARPFDREFIDQMIPHHQGAIRMAYAVLENGEDEETAELANAIIAAQSKEIAQMNRWRVDWYGATSPAGGAPTGHMDMGSMGSDHMSPMHDMGN